MALLTLVHETESEEVRTGGDGDVLLATGAESHRRSVHDGAGIEVPQSLAGLRVEGD